MKHHIVFKFIAIALCAVSLLGAVGCGLGILALTESNLYNKTVDQVIDERINAEGTSMAHAIASRYASIHLGGTPQALADQRFPLYSAFNHGGYGYALLDENGTELERVYPFDFENADTYSFPVSGQYIHTLSTLTAGEKYPQYQVSPDPVIVRIDDGEFYLYDALPPEGALIGSIYFTHTDGRSFEFSDGTGIGTAYYNRGGSMVCLFRHLPEDLFQYSNLTEIILYDTNGNLVYQAASAEGVGYFAYSENGDMMLVSTAAPEVLVVTEPTEETVAETTVEATVETTPETVPETVPETTVPEIEFDLVDNVPEDHTLEVIEMNVTFQDGDTFDHKDDEGIGRIKRTDSDTIGFTSYDPLPSIDGAIIATDVLFLDKDGKTILEASCPDGVGEFYYDDNDCLNYISQFPEPAETLPPETIPEETVPETTVPETVPEETAAATEAALETEEETIPEETVPETTEPIFINGKPLDEFEINNDQYFDHETDQQMYAEYVYTPMPEYTVELYLTEDALSYGESYQILQIVRQFRQYLLPVMACCILVFIVFAVYLCCAAGRTPKSDEVRAGALNRIPLDLYFGADIFAVTGLIVLAAEGGYYLMRQNLMVGCACALGCGLIACVLIVGFLFAFVAQIKTENGFWYRNTLCGHGIRLCAKFAVWLERSMAEKGFPFLKRMFRKLWAWTCAASMWLYRTAEKVLRFIGQTLGRIFHWIGNKAHRFLALLPLTWQWLLGSLAVILISVLFIASRNATMNLIGILLLLVITMYVSHCFGILSESTRRMSKGDLDTKVEDKLMLGCFKDFAADLNDLADVAVVAAQKQLKSERMKTELITNVSHDIKTPLTSIINYVDLLQKPHTEEEELQYLEVLNRQSLRLKKLIEDLMDMSKANTGNMAVEITQVDAVESVNQALGEFADKLDKAQLIPVFRHTDVSVPMMADGRLVWRVMSNLLGNAVKYAMPGTRLYVDLAELDGTVVISLKNISREELNVNADELMERFVRGDDSRNTEGSGLGLNIARSLMELQKGQLQLLVDGDLFKVTLIFPGIK